MMLLRNRKPKRPTRKGAAVAELAVCLPAIVMLVMGAIECCNMIFLRQSLHVTAYEGIRIAIRDGSDSTAVWDRCQRVIAERDINGSQVVITPSETQLVPRGNQISVAVSAPCASNNVLPLQFFGGNLSATATMVKE